MKSVGLASLWRQWINPVVLDWRQSFLAPPQTGQERLRRVKLLIQLPLLQIPKAVATFGAIAFAGWLSSGLVRGGTLTVERCAIRLSVVELTVLQEFVQTANRLFLVLWQP
jgi:hypothetical protein